MPVLRSLADYAYALMRIVFGLMFVLHGLPKIFGLFGGQARPPFTRLWAAGIIEIVGGLMIATGTYAAFAAFIASGEMAFAYFLSHFPKGFWPNLNGGELSALYCFAFLYIAARGGVKWALTKH